MLIETKQAARGRRIVLGDVAELLPEVCFAPEVSLGIMYERDMDNENEQSRLRFDMGGKSFDFTLLTLPGAQKLAEALNSWLAQHGNQEL